MREKWHSQRETVFSLPKPWDSRRNRDTWQVCRLETQRIQNQPATNVNNMITRVVPLWKQIHFVLPRTYHYRSVVLRDDLDGLFWVDLQWGSGTAPSDNFKNKEVKIVHSDAFCSDIFELSRQFWKQGSACNLTQFEKSSNFRKHFENKFSKACILAVFQTTWNCREKNESSVSKACILTVFQTTWNCRAHSENNGSIACILTYLKLFGTAENILKTLSLKHAFWRYLKRFRTAEKKPENNVSKACILAVFATS